MRVKIACDPVGEVLEAFVEVLNREGIFGDGFIPAVQCDGQQHVYLVKVQPFDGAFHVGDANASAFILICDAEDNCVSGHSNRVITIRGSRPRP